MNAFTFGGVIDWAKESPRYKKPNLGILKSPPIVSVKRNAETIALSILNESRSDMADKFKRKRDR